MGRRRRLRRSPSGSVLQSRRAATFGRFRRPIRRRCCLACSRRSKAKGSNTTRSMCDGPRSRMSSSSSPDGVCGIDMENNGTMSIPNPIKLLWKQFRSEWRLYVRDRGAMFWTFLFPLLILFGLGSIFRSGGAPALTLVRVPPAQATARDGVFVGELEKAKLKVVNMTAAQAEEQWSRGETVAQLESAGDGYRLRLNSYLVGQGQLVALATNQAFL